MGSGIFAYFCKRGVSAVQGHPRSLPLVPIESTYVTSSGVNASSKLGGTKRRNVWGVGWCVPLPIVERSGEGQIFSFVISKRHILVNFEVLNLKFLFIVSSLSEVLVEFLENFGFLRKAMNKRHQ